MSQCYREDEPLVKKRSEAFKSEVFDTAGELSFSGAVLILFCTAVGAGIVAIPRAFSYAGWAAGLLALMASASLSALSLTCLFKCAEAESAPSTYQSLVQKYLPKALSLFVDVAAAVLLLGAIGTMLLLAMHVWQSVELAVGVAALSPSHMPWVLLLTELVLCLPRNFSDLKWVTVANLFATMSVVLIMSVESAKIARAGVPQQLGLSEKTSVPEIVPATSISGLLAALPIALYGFFCQFQAPQLYSELQPQHRRHAPLIGGVATAGCFSIYACVGLLGYAAFGSNTESDILAQLTRLDPLNHWLCLGQVLFGCVLLLSTPLVLAPLRSMVSRSLAKESGSADTTLGVHVATTASILFVAMTIALNVPGVDFIMGVLGATCVVFLALIVPGLLTINCCGSDWKMAGHILLVAGLICAPLTFGAFLAKHLGYLPR